MKLIDKDIENYFITCGLHDLYKLRLQQFRNENYDELFISHFKNEFTNNGVLNNDYICKHCYEIIRSKKKKCKSKTNNNNNNNNIEKDNQKNELLNKSVIMNNLNDEEKENRIASNSGIFYN